MKNLGYTIQSQITENGGRWHTYYLLVMENPELFPDDCERLNKIQIPVRIGNVAWSREEIRLLRKNITLPLHQLKRIILTRTEKAIKIKKASIRKAGF